MADLKALREAVEAGTAPEYSFIREAYVSSVWAAISPHQDSAHRAYEGSLDAARKLHEAVCPTWVLDRLMIWGDMSRAYVLKCDEREDGLWHGAGDLRSHGESNDPARAWLIAILKALESEEATP